METPAPTVRLLMRLGYWSVWHGLHAEAAVLFSGAQAARPASEVPILGMAVLAIVMNQPGHAVELLRQASTAASNELIDVHQGCALRLMGEETAGMEILQRVANAGQSPDARQMAANLATLGTEQLHPQLAKIL
jgi:hypothetical protein